MRVRMCSKNKEKEALTLKGSVGWRQEDLKKEGRRNNINITLTYEILKNNYLD